MLRLFGTVRMPRVLGVDISSTTVKLLELSRDGDRYRVESYAVAPLPSEAVVEKNVNQIDVVGGLISELVTRSKTRAQLATAAVSGSAVIIKTIPMPAGLSGEDLEAQLTVEADQYIPYPLEEVNLDFQIIGETEDNPETVDVLLAACRSENVDDRVAAVELAGLTAKIVDVEAYTVETAFSVMASQMPDDGIDKTIAIGVC